MNAACDFAVCNDYGTHFLPQGNLHTQEHIKLVFCAKHYPMMCLLHGMYTSAEEALKVLLHHSEPTQYLSRKSIHECKLLLVQLSSVQLYRSRFCEHLKETHVDYGYVTWSVNLNAIESLCQTRAKL
jgi:hypothetical protein